MQKKTNLHSENFFQVESIFGLDLQCQYCRKRSWKMPYLWLVMDRDQNFRELRVNVISLLSICVKHKIHCWQFSSNIMILSEKLAKFQRYFTWNCWNYVNRTEMGTHDTELKWNMIPWNAENYFWAWSFCECEFTDPSLSLTIIISQIRKIH